MRVRKDILYCAGLFIALLLLMVSSAALAAPQAANFVGTWQMAMEGGRSGNGGGGGNGGGRGRGGAQTLTIAQDGDKFKVTHKTPRGEDAFDATVSGNTISWTETRERRNGNSMSIEYKATVDGDAMKGTMGAGQFSRPFTAKRSS